MQIDFCTFWMQKAGNSSDEYEDAFAPTQPNSQECAEFRCAAADGATETSFSGLWAQILVEAFVDQSFVQFKPETMLMLSALWHQAINARTSHKPLPWYAQEKMERGAFSSLIGLTIRQDGSWKALCVGDSCLFHVRPRQAIRAFPYHSADQFNNHPVLISTNAESPIEARIARGKWRDGDYFLLMTDALAHLFLSQRRLRAQFVAGALDQAGFAQLVESARDDRICRNDDVTFLKIFPTLGEGQGGVA